MSSSIRRLIPNLLTAGNLVGGILAIITALSGRLDVAPYFILISALLDFLDGFVARLLKVQSEMGKQLDSLADMVTFGVAPGIIVFVILEIPNGLMNNSSIQGAFDFLFERYFWSYCGGEGISFHGINLIQDGIIYNGQSYHYHSMDYTFWTGPGLSLMAFIIPVFSLFRLAKFNIDTRQSDHFIGLPTPAMTLFFASISLILFHPLVEINSDLEKALIMLFINPYFLIPATIIMSILMVVELPLFALKFKHFKWKGNEIRYIFLTICLVLLATLFVWALPIIVVLYILLSIINNLIARKGAKAQR